MFNRETHKSRGFGFIVFEYEDSAIQVCAEKEHVINGKAVCFNLLSLLLLLPHDNYFLCRWK